jgi:transcriptional regulator with XRE-family HTH domain
VGSKFDEGKLPDDLKALGAFLRSKRQSIDPAQRGIVTNRRRLSPGLSREETAALADIGASWYARLEAGHIPNPTLATMRAVARALALTPVERDFAFQLAGILTPKESRDDAGVADPIAEMFSGSGIVAMALWDRYLTPIGWNATADGMYGITAFPVGVERNALSQLESDFTRTFFGDDYEPICRNMVGMFRRSYAASEPAAARGLFEHLLTIPTFVRYWNDQHVADAMSPHGVTLTRHHPVAGHFRAVPVDLAVPEQGALLRILSPADAESREVFERLRAMGRAYDPALDAPAAVEAQVR